MKVHESKALNLLVKDVFDPEFVREVLDRRVGRQCAPRVQLLRSSTLASLVRKEIYSLIEKKGHDMRLTELASYTPSELKRMAKLGGKTLRWLEEYLHLLGVTLPQTNSVHGMSEEVRGFLATL